MFLLQNKQVSIASPRYWLLASKSSRRTELNSEGTFSVSFNFFMVSFSFLPYWSFWIFPFSLTRKPKDKSDGPLVAFSLSSKSHYFHNNSSIACFTEYS